MRELELDIVVTRGSGVESRHRVHAAVVDAEDRLIGRARDPGIVTMWRSCAKPFQVMPLITSGGFDEIGWGEDELTLACASHGGEPEHVAIAESMLRDLGLEEGDLACGPHDPLSPRGARILRDTGQRPTRLHNNCSGKHAAMLARAAVSGWEANGYEGHRHPVQEAILATVAHWSGVPSAKVGRAVDGCGVVVFGLPLDAMARSYARLADAAARGDIQAIILRAGDFYGPGAEMDWFDQAVMTGAKKGKVQVMGAKGVGHSWAYLPDLGRAFEALASLRQHLNGFERFHFAGHYVTQEEMGAAIAKAAPRPVKVSRFPLMLIKLAGLIDPIMREVGKMAYIWRNPMELKDGRLDELLGPDFGTPFEKAVAATVRPFFAGRGRPRRHLGGRALICMVSFPRKREPKSRFSRRRVGSPRPRG